ncbi:hypothetical protein N8804_01360 [Methylophilaceae bacterium]|nr:hypothetical protein [Methylophilaceae bacterium]
MSEEYEKAKKEIWKGVIPRTIRNTIIVVVAIYILHLLGLI